MWNFHSICRVVQSALFTLAAWSGGAAMVIAQSTPSRPLTTESGGAWVMAYMLVLLVVTLGLIVVCKSSGRRERAKPETYTEAKQLPKE